MVTFEIGMFRLNHWSRLSLWIGLTAIPLNMFIQLCFTGVEPWRWKKTAYGQLFFEPVMWGAILCCLISPLLTRNSLAKTLIAMAFTAALGGMMRILIVLLMFGV